MAASARALSATGFRALVALFVFSGAAGLVDQVCFSKYLSYVVGATAHAVSAVLAAFMTGLMVGATTGGWISTRVRRPLLAYGIAEVVAGASVALTPSAFAWLTPFYAGLAHRSGGSLAVLSLLRWFVAFVFVAVPTAAMGATLPLVSAALASGDAPDARPTRERRLTILYAANTFGGASGALFGAYMLLPALGLSRSVHAAAATSAFAGILAIALDRTPLRPPTPSTSPAPTPKQATGYRLQAPGARGFARFRVSSRYLILFAFPCGFLVFVLEAISTHILVSVIGTSSHAFRLVFVAFAISLAAAFALASRLSRRKNDKPLRFALSVSALAIAMTLPFRYDLALAFGGIGVVIPFLFLFLPTAAIGAVLPLGSAAIASGGAPLDQRTRKRRLGLLYAANAVCGASGALAGAYAALPALDVSTFVTVASASSCFAGLLAVYIDRSAAPPPAPLLSPIAASWLIFLAFLSGCLVFAMEVVSTHLLAVIIGNSTYAFGLILAAFLLSLSFGAGLARLALREAGDRALGYGLALSALAVALTLPLWDDLPVVFRGLGLEVTSFAGREAMRALVATGILVIPATCMGLTFPLVLQWGAARSDVGRFVGWLTGVNTAGAVVGALGTGYVALPALGSERALLSIAIVFAGAAFVTALRMTNERQWSPVVVAALSVAAALGMPKWDMSKLTAGTNVYFASGARAERLLYVREDVQGGITTVAFSKGVRTLYTNGKFQGNDSNETSAQQYFAHYPCLFVRSFDKALVIGLGTGTTLGTLSAYPWNGIDVLEISPAIVEAARRHFSHINRGALEDPRVRLTIADARNQLLVTERRYSLITMELSSVWFAGASSLYSAEFYRLIHDHLTDDGVYQQWVQMHHIYEPVFAVLVNTLRREFAHVALFYGGGQGILVASPKPFNWSRSESDRLQLSPRFSTVLPKGRPLRTLTDDILAMDEGLDRFLAESAHEAQRDLEHFVSNDDNLFLEYQTPRGNVLSWNTRETLVASLKTYRDEQAIAALEIDSPRPNAQ